MPLDISNQNVATGVKVPDAMTSLSNVANMANALQNFQFNKDTYNARVAQNAAQSTTAQNEAALTTANLQPKIEQQQAITSTAQTGAEAAKFGLHKDYTNTVLETASGLLQDPRITAGTPSNPNQPYDDKAAAEALEEARQQAVAKGVPAAQALAAVTPLVMQIHTPGAIQNSLGNTIKGMMSPAAQATQGMIPVSTQQQTGTDAVGNPIIINKNQYGAGTNISGAPIQGQVSTPPSVLPQGETPESRTAMIQNRTAVAQQALAIPEQHMYNQNVIKLASSPEFANPTGTGSATLSRIFGSVWSPNNDYATNTQQIAHNLAMATQANEAKMGVHTDAGRATTGLATGTTEMTPKALIQAAKMNDASSSGLAAYAQGNEAAIKNNGNNVFAQRQFQQQWASAYSPQVMMLHNAIQNGDKKGVTDIINSVGGPKSKGAQELANRANAIQSLVTTGSLPQGQ